MTQVEVWEVLLESEVHLDSCCTESNAENSVHDRDRADELSVVLEWVLRPARLRREKQI